MIYTLTEQEKNMNSVNLACVYLGQIYVIGRKPGVLILFLVSVACLIGVWWKQIDLRWPGGVVLSPLEIWTSALKKRGNSAVLLCPLIGLGLIYIGWWQAGGRAGAAIGCSSALIFATLVFLAERYPVRMGK